MEGNLRFKIDSGSPLVATKFTIFALFYFVFVGNFQIQAPPPPPRAGRRGLIKNSRYCITIIICGKIVNMLSVRWN